MACSAFLAAQCGWYVGVSRASMWTIAGPFAAGNASGSRAVMRACLCNSTSNGTLLRMASCLLYAAFSV